MIKLGLFTLIIFILVPVIGGMLVQNFPQGRQPSLSGAQFIYPESKVVQKIFSERDGLNAIALSIKNPDPNLEGEVLFNIKAESGEVVRSININRRHVPDGDYFKIKFDPILDSGGKYFEFSIKTTGGNQLPLQVYLTEQDLPNSELILDEVRQTREMAYVLEYKTGGFRSLGLILEDLKKKLLEDRVFTSFYILLIVSLIILLVRKNR